MAHTTFVIHINRRRIEAGSSPLTGLQILALGEYGPEYELYLLEGEGDPSGGRKIAPDESVELKDGMHFRAIPGNANFGLESGFAALETDVRRLQALGFETEMLYEGDQVGIVVKHVPLPPGYNCSATDLLLITTRLYPMSAMDMFWVSPGLLLASGGIPQAAESMEMHFGRPWRRYSWHRNVEWKPGRDDLVGHFEFAMARLQRAA